MDPLLTPTTALLHSLLEPSAFESPTPSQNAARKEPDVFSYSFAQHNSVQREIFRHDLSQKEGLRDHEKDYLPSANTWASAEQYITPPGTIDNFSQRTRNSSHESEQLFQLPPPPSSVLGLLPISPADEASFSNFEDCSVPSPFTETHPPRSERPKPVITRRNRKPISSETKALRHAQFLERNRVAANNCRKRKKAKNEGLEEQCRVLELRNTVLKDMKDDLMAELRELKDRMNAKPTDERNLSHKDKFTDQVEDTDMAIEAEGTETV